MQPFEIAWTAPEFEYRHKEPGWYWMTIIVAIIILGASVWMRNFLFGFFVVIAELLIIVWGNRQPRQIAFRLTEKSFSIENSHSYPLKEIHAWSVDDPEHGDWATITLNLTKRFLPVVRILAPKSRLSEIRSKLGELIPEVEHEDTFLDTLEKLFRF